jgi:hypothetical protein
MDSDKLPPYVVNDGMVPTHTTRRKISSIRLPYLGILLLVCLQAVVLTFRTQSLTTSIIPIHASETLQKCRRLHTKPGPPPDFSLRQQSDRFVFGKRPTLLRNATIWTGGINGLEIVEGDLLLDRGLIKAVGKIQQNVLQAYTTDLIVIDLGAAWVTPGYVLSCCRGTRL